MLEIKDSTCAPKWANSPYLRLEFDKELYSRLCKRDDFAFPIVNLPYLSSNTPEFLWYFCFTVNTLCSRLFEMWEFSVQMISSGFKVLRQGYYSRKFQTNFRKLYCHTDLVHKFDMLKDLLTNCDIWLHGVQLICGWIVTGATCEAGDGHSFRNTWFQSLWNLLFLGLCLRINYSGLFAWI